MFILPRILPMSRRFAIKRLRLFSNTTIPFSTTNVASSGRKPMSISFARSITSFPKRHPVIFGAVFTSSKTIAADIFVQTQIEEKKWSEIQWRRTAVFATFGFFYMGIAQYGVYVKFLAGRCFPNAANYAAKGIRAKIKDVRGTRDLILQVAFDQLFHIPFMFYPVYYVIKEVLHTDLSASDIQTPFIFRALGHWRTNFYDDMKTSWMIWWPCNMINFGFMPMHMRVPFMAVCSFVFCVCISVARGGHVSTDDALGGLVVHAEDTTTTTTTSGGGSHNNIKDKTLVLRTKEDYASAS